MKGLAKVCLEQQAEQGCGAHRQLATQAAGCFLTRSLVRLLFLLNDL